MELNDRIEEILERLWIELIENNKEFMDVSVLKDDDVLKEIVRLGLAKVKDNQIVLTKKGEEEAKNCVRRHRLAERLFRDVFEVKKELIHNQSCKFEHMLNKGLDENICILLGHPKTCPHGSVIPPGECCKIAKKTHGQLIVPLTELKSGIKARISYLETKNRDVLQKLIAISALPNTDIVLIQKFPSYVIQIGKSQFAIDKDLASHIYVRIVEK